MQAVRRECSFSKMSDAAVLFTWVYIWVNLIQSVHVPYVTLGQKCDFQIEF